MVKKSPKEFKPGQHVIVKLSNGRIEEARVNHVIQHPDGTKLQADFGHDETSHIELWQVLEDRCCTMLSDPVKSTTAHISIGDFA